MTTWIAFFNFTESELAKRQHVMVKNFFTIGHEKDNPTFLVDFHSKWLKAHGMQQKHHKRPPIVPTRLLNIKNLEKYANMPETVLTANFNQLMNVIEEKMLGTEEFVQIELRFVGLIMRRDKEIVFVANAKKEREILKDPFLAPQLMNIKNINENSSFQNYPKLQKFENTEFREPNQSILMQNSSSSKFKIKSKNAKPVLLKNNLTGNVDKNMTLKAQEQYTLKLDQTYSKKIKEPEELLNMQFSRPKVQERATLLIFDTYSHTKACPVSSNYNSLSVSSRIAVNYTPVSRYLYLDIDKQKIKVLIDNENKPGALTITDSSNDKSILNYYKYIDTGIQDGDVIDFPLKDIKKLPMLNQTYPNLTSIDLNKFHKQLLNEIQTDFKFACKKALLNYVLMNPEERVRLNILELPNNEEAKPYVVPSIGDTVYERRDRLSNQLLLFHNSTHRIKECWVPFEHLTFFELEYKPKDLNEFIECQRTRLTDLRNKLSTEWVHEISEIYKEIPNKKTARKYYDCMGLILSAQIRQLVNRSLDKYVKHIKAYNSPRVPKAFISIRLTQEEAKIKFDHEPSSVKKKLLELITDVIRSVENIPSPESFIYRSEKTTINFKPDSITNMVEELGTIIDNNLDKLAEVPNIFNKYSFLFDENLSSSLGNIVKRKNLIDLHKKYAELETELVYQLPSDSYVGMIQVDCSPLKMQLIETTQNLRKKIVDRVHAEILALNTKVTRALKASIDSIAVRVDSVERLIELEGNIQKFKKSDYVTAAADFNEILLWLQEFYLTAAEANQELLREVWETRTRIVETKNEIEKEAIRVASEREQIEQKLNQKKLLVINRETELQKNLANFKTEAKLFWVEKMVKEIEDLAGFYKGTAAEVEQINHEENILGFIKSDFISFKEAGRILKLFENFWLTIDNWLKNKRKWDNTNIFNFDVNNLESQVNLMSKTLFKTIKEFELMDPIPIEPKSIAELKRQEIEEYKQDVQIVKILCQEGLKDRHWQMINTLLSSKNGSSIIPTNKYTTENFKDLDLHNYITELEEIADTATKEYINEKAIITIESEWEEYKMDLKVGKAPGSYLITANIVDEVQSKLEDHLIKVQTMKGSQYAQVFKNRLLLLEESLQSISDTFSNWLKVQALWLYLEPIFASEDIIKSLPAEGAKFRDLNEEILNYMRMRKERPNIIDLSANKDIQNMLIRILEDLEIINKSLEGYLERKRSLFPRFYFLSSDSLIDILSQSKEPLKLQKYIKILFEGMAELQFSPVLEIEGMRSSEGEYIPFEQKIVPDNYKGLVERWLIVLEEMMAYEVKKFTIKSLDEYSSLPIETFILNRPAQAIVNVMMTVWTFETEHTIAESGKEGLKDYLSSCINLIQNLVALFETELNHLDRLSLETLLIICVHNRDILRQLIDNDVETITDFNYEAQMRYYWEGSEGINNCIVKIMNTVHDYSYEYIGNCGRLVITPLTDRCYRTLCGAAYLSYGGAPEGPAGTGKTETVKDLAKALARMIIVFNCSDEMDNKSMERFLKGLACTGGWSCFDEFNRIEPEVLSVVAQQLQKIQLALVEKKNEFFFEGSLIKLKPTCNCYITMNPGYAGRAELPDNLKSLFRSVAMMVPDYAMIAEIRLFACGFQMADKLAKKIVTTYKLCSEQISPQKHYDYGMRAVNATLNAAGTLKNSYPLEEEPKLILRALLQVNEAKFLAKDLPLFRSIVEDLFPGLSLAQHVHQFPDTQDIIMNDYFNLKVQQVREVMEIRHGIMLVGDAYSGKSTSLTALAKELTNVELSVLNPKAISAKDLYGYNDTVSNEWADGILTVQFKQLIEKDVETRKWLVLDGPVDAEWIENLNTVLDDNKKLCLANGDVFYMAKNMNIVFEVENLAEASPATVSRCGMVFFEQKMLGWDIIYKAWLKKMPQTFKDLDYDKLDIYFKTIFKPLLEFSLLNFDFVYKPSIQQIVAGVAQLSNKFLQIFEDKLIYDSLELKERTALLDNVFVFSTVWSLGNLIHHHHRKAFDSNFKKFINSCDRNVDPELARQHRKIRVPESGQLYDYKLFVDVIQNGDKPTVIHRWTKWSNILAEKNKTDESPSLIIKTPELLAYESFIAQFIEDRQNILVCGPSGSGKTMFLNEMIKELNKDVFSNSKICFSGQTSTNQLQTAIKSLLIKRRDIFGPPNNKKLVLFIDDLNMPKKEKYGAQPPIELLRQLIDQGGFYNIDDSKFMHIKDIITLGAMTIHGSSNRLTDRFMRHFKIIPFNEYDSDQMFKIYNTLATNHFVNGFSEDIQNKIAKVVTATLDVYIQVKHEFLPLPTKIHYMFNLRDLTKVIKGLCMSDRENYKEPKDLYILWVHEVWRVFSDRLCTEDDRLKLLNDVIKPVFQKVYVTNFDNCFDFLDIDRDNTIQTLAEMRDLAFTNIGNDDKYKLVSNKQKLVKLLESALETYNSEANKPLDIILFAFAIEHLLIIYRILKQDNSHAMLVGVGGSGRKSLAQLAAYIAEQELFIPQMDSRYGHEEWQEDLKKILKTAGRLKPVVFYFTEANIKDEGFIEDINSLLNNGKVPNLFNAEDKGEIQEMIGTLEDPMETFSDRVKMNLTIVLSFSPIGSAFKDRVQLYPAIINCCNVDWFFEWPVEALEFIAMNKLTDINLETDKLHKSIELLQYFHSSAKQYNDTYSRIRPNYITSGNYMEALSQFKLVKQKKYEELVKKAQTYKNGYKMIIESEASVASMQQRLESLKPELEAANIETSNMMTQVAENKLEADKVHEIVTKDEEEAREKALKTKEISDECKREVDLIQPELDKARSIVEKISKKDFDDLRGYKQAPLPIQYALQCLCIILDSKHEMKKDLQTFRMVIDWWATSKKMLLDLKLKTLLDFDNEKEMNDTKYEKLNQLFTDPKTKDYLEESAINFSSPAAAGMFLWVKGQMNLYIVNKKIKPKKEALEVANKEFEAVNVMLKAKQKDLDAINRKVKELNINLNIIKSKKTGLEREYKTCIIQTERARKLIDNLFDEKERWLELSQQLEEIISDLLGSIIISAGYIAYLGPFNPSYRNKILKDWVAKTKEIGLMNEDREYQFHKFMGDALEIRDWTIKGLPTDVFSLSNAIIMKNHLKYSLVIDPQIQANKYLKNREKENRLSVVKQTDMDFVLKLENAIRFGATLLVEDIGETLNPLLNTVLEKQLVKDGGSYSIKMGDKMIDFNNNFKLFITTRLTNPHYLPEVTTKVNIINFKITSEGLKDQIQGQLVLREKPDLESLREQTIVESFNNRKILSELEAKILEKLSLEKKLLLEDETALNVLTASKQKSRELAQKQALSEETEKKIELARFEYSRISDKIAALFFAVDDLVNIETMYQYSLEYYLQLVDNSIMNSEKFEEIERRLYSIFNHFIRALYKNISRSIFAKDKLVFSFLLFMRLISIDEATRIDESLYNFFLTGILSSIDIKIPKPNTNMITDKQWEDITYLSNLDSNLSQLNIDISRDIIKWESALIFEDVEDFKVPEPYGSKITKFEKAVLLKILRIDRLKDFIKNYIEEDMGSEYTKEYQVNLTEIYKETTCNIPILFILTPGVDPYSNVRKLAQTQSMRLENVSLGQGQGPAAKKLIKEAMENGHWVILQNCHLAISFLPELQLIYQNMKRKEEVNRNFRLWLTSYPTTSFPLSVLQGSLKITIEPANGLKQNLINTLNVDILNSNNFTDSVDNKQDLLKLSYGLCFFHALIIERKQFGHIGWNIPYEFTESDLRISLKQIQIFLERYTEEVPLDALNYLISECNYGGRVTDDKDRRLITTLLAEIFNDRMIESRKYLFTKDVDDFYITNFTSITEMHNFAKNLNDKVPVAVLGFHANASMTKDINGSTSFVNTLLMCNSDYSTNKSKDFDRLLPIIDTMSTDIPNLLDIHIVEKKFPVIKEESLNTFLHQEVEKYNRLLTTIKLSFENLQAALKGQKLLTNDLSAVMNSILQGKVPNEWLKVSYPSLKPLNSYIKNLKDRCNFINNWIKKGQPIDFWLPGFFFTQGFLTCLLQNYARKYAIPIDQLNFNFEIIDSEFDIENEEVGDSTFIYGLFLEGAGFDYKSMSLIEAEPKKLFVENIRLKLTPYQIKQNDNESLSEDSFKSEQSEANNYDCPLYRTIERRGELLTTGHSTNFVLYVNLPTEIKPEHWIKRGVALILELDD